MSEEKQHRSRFRRFWTTIWEFIAALTPFGKFMVGLATLLAATASLLPHFAGGGSTHGRQEANDSRPQKGAYSTRSTTTPSSKSSGGVVTTPARATTVPSQHEWQHELNTICRETGRDVQARETEQEVKPGEAAAKEIQDDAWLSMDRQLRALTSPPEDELKLLKMTEDWDNAIEDVRSEIMAEKESEDYQLKIAQERFNKDNDAGNHIAYELGLGICAEEPE